MCSELGATKGELLTNTICSHFATVNLPVNTRNDCLHQWELFPIWELLYPGGFTNDEEW